MTIQLLQTWAGKPAGIYTLDPGEESRLIGLGLARAYVLAMDGTAGDGAGEAVIAATTLPIAAAAGAPVMAGMLLRDPATGLIYGQSDGAGGYDPLGAAVATYTAAQLSAMAAAGTLTPYATYIPSDAVPPYTVRAIDAYTLVPDPVCEATPYVTLTASGIAFTGACELAGYYGSVAAGNITVYDALSATGTPIVPTQAVVAGPNPIFGAGTNGKLILGTGCYVVLSGAATVRMLVGGG